MRKFEYMAVPAPTSGTKAKGTKTNEARFALSLTNLLNEMAQDGWEYVRAETLPCDTRKGLTGSQTTYQNILIFRKLEAPALHLDRNVSQPIFDDPEPAPEPDPAPQITTQYYEENSAPRVRLHDD